MKLWRAVLLASALVAGGAIMAAAETGTAETAPQTEEQAATARTGPNIYEGPQSFAELVRDKSPAVVAISTRQSRAMPEQPGTPETPPRPPFEGAPFEDFFRDFFDRFGQPGQPGDPRRGPRPAMAVGSGFIIDPEGYVVTNNHVIAEADEVRVVLEDDTELPAEVVGRDPRTDLALLKVEPPEPLPAVEWGDSDAVQVGDWVVAIGNPFGLGGTVTAGIVSGRARDINAGPYDDFLQTDAAINQGNSGGPMFNLNGEVIGVNTAILSPTGGSIGIGFAVPSAVARPIIEELRASGAVERGWLGVSIQPLTEEIAEALALEGTEGALVASVLPDSPAARAGLRAGDVILSFAGQPVGDVRQLQRVVADTPVNEEVEVVVHREGERMTLQAEIARLEEETAVAAAAEPEAPPPEAGATTLGLSLVELSPEVRRQYDIPEGTQGVLVSEVEPGSVAEQEGIAPGDVLIQVGQQPVQSPDDVLAAVETARQEDRESILLLREREGSAGFVALPLRDSGTG